MDQYNSTTSSSEGTIGAAPVASADRIKSIDAIRGFALLGILMMNIPGFGMNWDFWYTIFTGPRSGYDYLTMEGVSVFFEGTMRSIYNTATVSWGNNTTCTYPETWLRFRRVGNTFLRYSSTNGANWLLDGQTSPSPVFP